MPDFPLIVSYYTTGTLYQLEVQNLIASLEKFQLEAVVEPIASFGSWEKNCAYKPLFLLEKLERLRRPLLWVDADAVFCRQPRSLPAFAADLALRINAELPLGHPSYMMSGTLYVNATLAAERVLKLWAKGCIDELSDVSREFEVWDQMVLSRLLQQEKEAKVAALPEEYAKILEEEELGGEGVIVHYQASRRLKKTISSTS